MLIAMRSAGGLLLNLQSRASTRIYGASRSESDQDFTITRQQLTFEYGLTIPIEANPTQDIQRIGG
jgi:hypothetical protein